MHKCIPGAYYDGKRPIFKEINFSELIQDDLPRSTKTFFEKYESERYALTLPFQDFKISLPSSISKGQNMYDLFSKLTLHVNDIEDFNELPIPFFCIATNILWNLRRIKYSNLKKGNFSLTL